MTNRYSNAAAPDPLGAAALPCAGPRGARPCRSCRPLVGQDPPAALRALMKLAGGSHLHDMDVDEFIEARNVSSRRATPARRGRTSSRRR
ncbi:hypothetical protein [Dactylosporangium sp. NPDC051541]|uniref:hypothetical protein n=1 Tax=Dactylosporangium sp. NPDC051541 TaxID=3363977 RepID=UPI0037930FC6